MKSKILGHLKLELAKPVEHFDPRFEFDCPKFKDLTLDDHLHSESGFQEYEEAPVMTEAVVMDYAEARMDPQMEAEVEVPVAEVEVPVAEVEVPVAKVGVPVAEVEAKDFASPSPSSPSSSPSPS